MFKKFSFWIIFILIGSIGSVVFIHWNTIQRLHKKTAEIQPLYQRQKTLDTLSLSLERYRRMSSSFRKLTPEETGEIKNNLKMVFAQGVMQLDQLNPTPEEVVHEHQLNDQLAELLSTSAQIERMLFTKDAYQKAEIVGLQEQILNNLMVLEKNTEARISLLDLGSSRTESQSVFLLLAVGLMIFTLLLATLLRNHLSYFKPLERLYKYAQVLKDAKVMPQDSPHFSGMYGEIQGVLNVLALSVETHMKSRHKFILDIASDLKAPLSMLQAGKYLIGKEGEAVDEQHQAQAAESVRRGLAIFSGSLDDLNDIVDINRLESRLEEKTVDLSEMLSDVSRTLIGPLNGLKGGAEEVGKRIHLSVPPIPVWAHMDARRMERVLIQVLSKVLGTITDTGSVTVSLMQLSQGNTRGVEILIQDTERLRSTRPGSVGPEQDILKHWISENGLSMTLAHKIIKAHGGTITAAGVAGTSLTVIIRLPQERIVSRGLISPPSEEAPVVRGLVGAPERLRERSLSQGA